MKAGMNMIYLEHLSKTIKGNKVLDDINLNLKEGVSYGLEGINGSGKTMLMRMISGLIYPDKGYVIYNGKRLGKDMDFPPNIGLLIEKPVFMDNFSGFQNLTFLASLSGRGDNTSVCQAIQRAGLSCEDSRKYKKIFFGDEAAAWHSGGRYGKS